MFPNWDEGFRKICDSLNYQKMQENASRPTAEPPPLPADIVISSPTMNLPPKQVERKVYEKLHRAQKLSFLRIWTIFQIVKSIKNDLKQLQDIPSTIWYDIRSYILSIGLFLFPFDAVAYTGVLYSIVYAFIDYNFKEVNVRYIAVEPPWYRFWEDPKRVPIYNTIHPPEYISVISTAVLVFGIAITVIYLIKHFLLWNCKSLIKKTFELVNDSQDLSKKNLKESVSVKTTRLWWI